MPFTPVQQQRQAGGCCCARRLQLCAGTTTTTSSSSRTAAKRRYFDGCYYAHSPLCTLRNQRKKIAAVARKTNNYGNTKDY